MLTRKRIILAKIETTYGTDPTPTGAANAILVKNLNVMPLETDVAERDLIRPFLGASDRIIAASRVMVEFEVDMMGSGAAGTAPHISPLLRACGMAETISAGVSVLYKPVSAAFESVTIYANVDGVLHKLTGARGNVSVELNVKQLPVFKFQFTGIFNPVTDAALPVPTYPTTVPLAVNNTNTTLFTFQGYAAQASQISLDLGNTIVHRTLIGGTEGVLISDRKASGNLQIESINIAAKDYFTNARNATTGLLTVTHGTAAGNKVKVDAPAASISKPSYTDMDGIQMTQFDLSILPTAAGNDELQFTFT